MKTYGKTEVQIMVKGTNSKGYVGQWNRTNCVRRPTEVETSSIILYETTNKLNRGRIL